MLDVQELSVCCLKKRILLRKIENYFLQAQRAMMTGIDDDTKNSFTQRRRQQIESTSAHIPHCFRASE